MKTQRNIFIAFILNLFFAFFELAGGIFTSSVAIMSDALHDLGDAASIGLSFFLEKKSKKEPDNTHSYGYARYSVLGGVITNLILVAGSFIVLTGAAERIINPVSIHKDGMIVFAVVGVLVNLTAAFFTKGGGSFNQKAVNLHLLEDVLGWIAVLLGGFLIKFTNLEIIDPLISIAVSLFILFSACRNLKEATDLFLEKTPHGIDIEKIKAHIMEIDGVIDVHHIHIWSLDSYSNYATMHIVTNKDTKEIKLKVKHRLDHLSIHHTTLELEEQDELCQDICCQTHIHDGCHDTHCHHHHHHHH